MGQTEQEIMDEFIEIILDAILHPNVDAPNS